MSVLSFKSVCRAVTSASLAVVVGAALTGCSGASDDDPASPSGSIAGAAAGDVDTITWGLPFGEPRTVDPIFGLDYSPSLVTSQMCDTLLRTDAEGALVPGLASFEQPDDTTIVYTLKGGATFWDGKPVTAEDVAWNLQRAADPSSYLALIFANVDNIDVTGDDEVTVTLKQPDALLNKEMAAFSGSIMEKAWSVDAGNKLGTPSAGVMCSGPFELTSWTPGKSLVLSRNDNYWDDEYSAHAKTIEFRFFDDSTALTQALLSGEVDGAYEVPASEIPTLSNSSEGQLFTDTSRQYVTMERRRTTGPIADDKLREAIFGSIDREGIAEVVFAGAAKAAWTLVTPSSWDPEAQSVWSDAYQPFEDAGRISANDAKALVDESGYDGTPVELAVLSGDVTQSQLAQVIQESASQIGVTITIKTLQPTAYSEALVDGRADAGDLIMTVSFNIVADPIEQIPYYVLPSSPYNYTKYEDKDVIALYEKALQTLDAEKRAELLTEAQEKYEAAYEFTSLVQKDEVMFLNNRLAGAPTTLDYLFEPSLALVGAAE